MILLKAAERIYGLVKAFAGCLFDKRTRPGTRSPVDKWTQAYTSYSYNVRVFAFSEHREAVRVAARMAIEDVTSVKSDAFYERALRAR